MVDTMLGLCAVPLTYVIPLFSLIALVIVSLLILLVFGIWFVIIRVKHRSSERFKKWGKRIFLFLASAVLISTAALLYFKPEPCDDTIILDPEDTKGTIFENRNQR